MKTRDRLIIWGALVVLVLAGRLYSACVTPYSYLGGTGNGAIMRTANGGFTSSWETDYRVNRLSGIVEIKHTDLTCLQASYDWQAVSSRAFSSYILLRRLLP